MRHFLLFLWGEVMVNKIHHHWHSRWLFIMAATGSAVGLGNIWKFPYVAGESGGAAFVLVYLACIVIIGIPILMAETLLGRHGDSNPFSAMIKASRDSDASKLWAIIALMSITAGLLIMSFYSVVAGWVLNYIGAIAQGTFTGVDSAFVENYLDNVLMANKELQLVWHSVFTFLTVGVLAFGVNKGLGNAIKVLMPMLFILLAVSLGYSFQSGHFMQGFHFMFDPDFSKLTPEIVLMAMGQAFFSLSLGMGAIMTYGSYMDSKTSITQTAFIIAGLDTLVAIMAGLVIFPLVFANGLTPSEGPGLMFLSLPIAFGNMPGGVYFGTAFFVLIAVAAWSSSVSLIEPALSWLSEKTPMNRTFGAMLIGLTVWVGGLACIYVDGIFDIFDIVTSQYLLPIGGLLIAIFVGWVMKRKIAKTQLSTLSYFQFNCWYATIRVFCPLGVMAVILYGLWPAISKLFQ